MPVGARWAPTGWGGYSRELGCDAERLGFTSPGGTCGRVGPTGSRIIPAGIQVRAFECQLGAAREGRRFWNQGVSVSSISAAPTKSCYGKEGVSGIKASLIRLSQLPPTESCYGKEGVSGIKAFLVHLSQLFPTKGCHGKEGVSGITAFLIRLSQLPPLKVVMGRKVFLQSRRF